MYSFVTAKSSKTELELLKTEPPSSPAPIEFKVLKGSLSANNKFYLDFGEKPPFAFFKTYPVPEDAQLVGENEAASATDYAHPPVWGLCEVTKSEGVEGVAVGTVYRAMLPMAPQVSFPGARLDPVLGNLIVTRPATMDAYNAFSLIPKESVGHPDSPHHGLALACSPGIVTGFGLCFALQQAEYYGGCDTLVLTAASSKVSLSLALYMKDVKDKKIVGYTSKSNKEFCRSTGLYSELLDYDEAMPESWGRILMVDVSGKGTIYAQNQARIQKLLCIGNASGTADKESTFAHFSPYATLKMMLTMMGGPQWIRSRMNPKAELFLIMDTMKVLIGEWGKDKYLATLEEYTKTFCEEASKWMQPRNCETEDTIKASFQDIVKGTVPPSEYVVLDVAAALADRQ